MNINIDDLFESSIESVDKVSFGVSIIDDVSRWIEIFKNDMREQSRSINTIDTYMFTLKAFSEYLINAECSHHSLEDISASECNEFLSWMENYSINKQYGGVKDRVSIVVDFIKKSKMNGIDFIEARESYFETLSEKDNMEKINFALDEFENYYFKNEIPFEKIENNYIINYIALFPKASISTMQNRRAVLHKFFSFITEETETEKFKDVLRKMKKFKKEKGQDLKKKKHESISDEDKKEFFSFLDTYINNPMLIQSKIKKETSFVANRDVLIIFLMYRGGLRISEALNLKFTDIELINDEVYKINIIGGKGNKNRTTYIKKVHIDKYIQVIEKMEYIKDDYIASSIGRNTLIDRRYMYDKVSKLFLSALGKEIKGLHLFRHLFGSEFASQNGNIKILQDLLGHSSINTTMIYSQTNEEAKINSILPS